MGYTAGATLGGACERRGIGSQSCGATEPTALTASEARLLTRRARGHSYMLSWKAAQREAQGMLIEALIIAVAVSIGIIVAGKSEDRDNAN